MPTCSCYNQPMKPHFLQSSSWQKYQELEGHQSFFLDQNDFSALAILETTPLGNYLFCPYGPTLKLPDSSPYNAPESSPANANSNPPHSSLPDHSHLENALKLALNSLSELAKQQNAIFVRLEPTLPLDGTLGLSTADFQALGLKKSHDLEPAHTWTIDLTQPEPDLLKNMRKSNVQYWRSSSKKSLTVRQTTDPSEISILTDLLKKVSEKDHFNPQAKSHLKNQLKSGFATLYIAEFNDRPLAAALVYDSDDTRFYAHAAASDEERKLAAGTVLLVQIILDAKSAGKTTFDFWGITTSEDPHHPWYGFSQYKKSFGGELVTYSGTWDLPIQKFRYRLYTLLRSLNRLKRKFLK